MTIKHTPGPWDCTGAMFPDDDMGGVYYRIQADGIDMRAANARLIAAAPELLAVAQRMLDFANDGATFNYPLGSLQQLEQVIAKAKGAA